MIKKSNIFFTLFFDHKLFRINATTFKLAYLHSKQFVNFEIEHLQGRPVDYSVLKRWLALSEFFSLCIRKTFVYLPAINIQMCR